MVKGIVALVFSTFLLAACSPVLPYKINGLSFVASREPVRQEHITPLLEVRAGFAAIMPFGFMRDPASPDILFDTDRQWYGETREGALQYIRLLHANNVRIMLKPQLWIHRGQFTGHLEMEREADWQALEASYSDFILSYARLAEEAKVELFCIGTELQRFVSQRPDYWGQLITQIRGVYKGKLTYAANWDEYEKTPFWEQLDYIGVDAYFPLSEERTPSVNSLSRAWKPWKERMAALSDARNRKVLFTEFGYRSMDFAAKRPWTTGEEDVAVNLEAQANAKEAIFRTFWKEDWFAGGFVWKWFVDHSGSGGASCNRFTPQNKPAQEIIRSHFSRG